MKIYHLHPKKIFLNFQEVKNYIESIIKQNERDIIVTLNTEMFIDSLKNEEFKKIIDNSVVVIDSVGIAMFYQRLYGNKIDPINGIELAEKLISFGYRVFILGSKEENLLKAIENIKKAYQMANIVGYYNGYFKDDEVVVEKINSVKPEILLIGMGSPKQEKWIYTNKEKLDFRIAIGIGGSIDVWAGVYKRAPVILRKMKLEWAYRLFTDLKRIPRIIKLIKFIPFLVLGRKNG